MKLNTYFSLCLVMGLMVGCSDSTRGDTESEPITISLQCTRTIADRGEGFLLIEKPVCREGVYSVILDTGFYQLAKPGLISWYKKGCTAVSLSGTNKTINGTWTIQDATAEIPGGADENCQEMSEIIYGDNRVSGTMTFTDTEKITDAKITLCYADVLLEEMDNEEALNYATIGCDGLQWKRNGDVGTFKFIVAKAMSQISVEFSFKGETCRFDPLPDVAPTAEVCSFNWTDAQSEGNLMKDWDEENFMYNPENLALEWEFDACINRTGFGAGKEAIASIRGLNKMIRQRKK